MIKKVITEEWETSDRKRFPIEDREEALQYEVEYQEARARRAENCVRSGLSLIKKAEKAEDVLNDSSEWSRGRYLGGHE